MAALQVKPVPMQSACSARRGCERGALLPIVAVLALGVLAVALVLGLETSRVKSMSTLIRRHLERVCRVTAPAAFLPEEAVRRFQTEITRIPEIPGLTFTRVRLVLPFPSDAGVKNTFYRYADSETCSGDYMSYSPDPQASVSRAAVPFGELGGSGQPGYPCRVWGTEQLFPPGGDCELVSDVCVLGQGGRAPLPNYPRTLWSDLYNSGNTVGCEIEAEVEPLLKFTPARQVSGKVAWWIPLRATPPFLEGGGGGTPQPADFAGISIGVATELTTWAGDLESEEAQIGDARFKTSIDADAPVNPQELDPRTPGAGGAPKRRFDFDDPGSVYSSTFKLPQFDRLADSGGGITPSSEEMMAACFNPLVLSRNLLLSALTEFAARHGQTRNLTEIAHINPKHRVSGAPPNRPVVMVPFGSDLMNRDFQAPFVTYDSGMTGLFEKKGFILPWEGYGVPAAPDLNRHHALIAQQLRICYHLYTDTAAAPGTPRIPLPLHTGLQGLIPPYFRFTDSSLHSPGSLQSWDFGAPWSVNAAAAPGRRLSAPELMYTLGSTQSCPIDKAANGPLWTNFECTKNGLASLNDLLPDLVGYLDYQLYGGSRAYPSPGLSPPLDAAGAVILPASGGQPDLLRPMQETTPAGAKLPRSVVLVVVHKGLSDSSGDIGVLRNQVTQLNSQGRPVIFIFMPGTAADSETFKNYCRVLDLGDSCDQRDPGNLNAFFFLSPFNESYGRYYSHFVSSSAVEIARPEPLAFYFYWADLTQNQPDRIDDPYYYDIARTIFTETILRLEPKL